MHNAYDAYQQRNRSAHEQYTAAVNAYLDNPADLIGLRWFRRAWGFGQFPQTTSRREQLAAVLHEHVHVAAIELADETNREWDDPDVLADLDMDSLWAEAVAEVTERETRNELDDKLGNLDPKMNGDPEQDTQVIRYREVLGLIHSWRTGAPVPKIRVVGWSAAAERVGLQPSDLRARASRGQFPEREDEERAAYGQMNPVWFADTLDSWWERKPARGPRRWRMSR